MAKKIEETVDKGQLSKTALSNFMKDKEIAKTHYNFVEVKHELVPSGSLILDMHLKLKSGTSVRMGGPAGTGKTSSSMGYANNYMQVFPKSKTIYFDAESKLNEDVQAKMGYRFVNNADDWDCGTILVFKSNCFDTICSTLKLAYQSCHEAGEQLCAIIDSVDMLMLKSNMDKELTEGRKPAGVNFLTKELFRQLSGMNMNYNGLMIFVTQYSATFTMDKYEKEAPNLMDGNQTHALNHQITYALYYQPRYKSHYILEKPKEKPDKVENKILGVYAKIDIRKSTTENTGYTIEVPIKFEENHARVWTEKEIFDVLVLMGLMKVSGAWIDLDPVVIGWGKEANLEIKPKHQGENQMSSYFGLPENKPILDLLVSKIKLLYS